MELIPSGPGNGIHVLIILDKLLEHVVIDKCMLIFGFGIFLLQLDLRLLKLFCVGFLYFSQNDLKQFNK